MAVTPRTCPLRHADQVERHPFDEELGIGLDVALVHGVQHGVTGTVSRGTGTTHRLFAEVRHVAAERTLVDLAVVGTVKRHAVVFEFNNNFVGLLHMNSMASWSPSQSEPLTVSYMCHVQ